MGFCTFLICKVHFHYKWQFNITLLCHAKYTAPWQSINWTNLRCQRKFPPPATALGFRLALPRSLSQSSRVARAAAIYQEQRAGENKVKHSLAPRQALSADGNATTKRNVNERQVQMTAPLLLACSLLGDGQCEGYCCLLLSLG